MLDPAGAVRHQRVAVQHHQFVLARFVGIGVVAAAEFVEGVVRGGDGEVAGRNRFESMIRSAAAEGVEIAEAFRERVEEIGELDDRSVRRRFESRQPGVERFDVVDCDRRVGTPRRNDARLGIFSLREFLVMFE